jgi:hypothetical protein
MKQLFDDAWKDVEEIETVLHTLIKFRDVRVSKEFAARIVKRLEMLEEAIK